MTCHELDERLDDYVDGTLSPAEADAVAEHLASCPSCREAERRTQRLLAHVAALPRSVAPPRDLWPAIERAISGEGRFARGLAWRPGMMLAAAATVLLGILAAVAWRGTPGATGPQTVAIPETTPTYEPVSTLAVADPALAEAEREYEAAAKTLLAVLQQRRSRIAPADLARVEDNVAVIDRALAEVREALAKDPVNPELNRMLVATHRKKVDVLRRVVRLSTAL
jgi:predicted anti-sigma-YlaC factor YlaD